MKPLIIVYCILILLLTAAHAEDPVPVGWRTINVETGETLQESVTPFAIDEKTGAGKAPEDLAEGIEVVQVFRQAAPGHDGRLFVPRLVTTRAAGRIVESYELDRRPDAEIITVIQLIAAQKIEAAIGGAGAQREALMIVLSAWVDVEFDLAPAAGRTRTQRLAQAETTVAGQLPKLDAVKAIKAEAARKIAALLNNDELPDFNLWPQ